MKGWKVRSLHVLPRPEEIPSLTPAARIVALPHPAVKTLPDLQAPETDARPLTLSALSPDDGRPDTLSHGQRSHARARATEFRRRRLASGPDAA
jgi:hypothetical protein